jgi:hypothetical protein
MDPLHDWAIAERIEQIAQDRLEMNCGTLCRPRLEQNGWTSSEWGTLGEQPRGALLFHHPGSVWSRWQEWSIARSAKASGAAGSGVT